MAVKQLSIFVENKEGKLVTITDAIANANIDIRAMSVADTTSYSWCVRIVAVTILMHWQRCVRIPKRIDVPSSRNMASKSTTFAMMTTSFGVAVSCHCLTAAIKSASTGVD